MPPRTRTNEELVEETAKRTAKLVLEEVNSGTGTGSRITQIIKEANKGKSSPHQNDDLEKIEKEKEAIKADREALKSEKEKAEKEKAEKEKAEKEKAEKETIMSENKRIEELEKEKSAISAEKEKLIKDLEVYKIDKEKLEEAKKNERIELEKVKEKLEKDLEDTEVFCPTCSGGSKHEHEHKHKLKKTENGRMKCTGEGCNTEYALIPTNADYVCMDCGLPHKKPEVEVPDDKCPFCSSQEFYKKDWSAIINKKTKRKLF